MKTIWIDKELIYTGAQLRSHWVSENTGIYDDVIACFIGPADVPLSNMVDLEDVRNLEPIASAKMIHFIAEFFDSRLDLAIARQRLLVCIACECLSRAGAPKIERRGDDIYASSRKLSVSIATVSPVSTLVHFALNITTKGTPLATSSLEDLKIDPENFGLSVMKSFIEEIDSMHHAKNKVRSVG
jgi:hypothetical protein